MEFIYGKEGFLIDQEVNRSIRKYGIDPIIYSDGEPLSDILLDVSTASMFSDEKLLIIRNHPAFSKNDSVDEFIEGIQGNVETKMIFVLETERLDKKAKLVKFLLANAEIKEFKSLEEKNAIPTIKQIVETKGGSIDNSAAILLASKLPIELRIIVSEVEKLLLENSHINSAMVETSIGEYIKNNYFALSNAIITRDAHEVVSAYKKKKIAGEDVTLMISQIASTLSLSLSVSAYRKQGLSNKDISDKMKIHIFRVKKAGDLLNSSNTLGINKLILSLAKLEEDIKTGKIDPNHGIEIYLLNLIK